MKNSLRQIQNSTKKLVKNILGVFFTIMAISLLITAIVLSWPVSSVIAIIGVYTIFMILDYKFNLFKKISDKISLKLYEKWNPEQASINKATELSIQTYNEEEHKRTLDELNNGATILEPDATMNQFQKKPDNLDNISDLKAIFSNNAEIVEFTKPIIPSTSDNSSISSDTPQRKSLFSCFR